uniref:Uncharacterized protein n=1 Tax=Chelonoidis abingdonii TaxID=106734 RepID=A0A8C0FZS1_CHEAB
MYAVYRQAHPPTGVEFSMYCNFFSNAERNLVVAGTSQLYVYRLNHDSEVPCPLAKPSSNPTQPSVSFCAAAVSTDPIYVRLQVTCDTWNRTQ